MSNKPYILAGLRRPETLNLTSWLPSIVQARLLDCNLRDGTIACTCVILEHEDGCIYLTLDRPGPESGHRC